MDDNEKEDQQVDDRDEKEIAKEIEDKLMNAFNAFDKEGSGCINSSEVKFVLEMVDVKLTEAEMFKMISEIDPENTG